MDLTREYFYDFVDRLRYHNEGKGVDDHCTANPIFIVQKKEIISGIDPDYDPSYFWTDADHEGEYNDSEMKEELKSIFDGDDGDGPDDYDLAYDAEITCNAGKQVLFRKIGYIERWEYVCAHFTKEGAEAFIARKKHDYRQLRVYVDCQYHCWEFNTIVQGLLDGKIIFNAS